MKLSKYRVRSGHYRVRGYEIIGGSRIRWQLRDEDGDIIDDYRTLRDALHMAIVLSHGERELRRPDGQMTELAEMLRI
jgi:hypothetical protein